MSAPDFRISGYAPASPSTEQMLAGLPAAELSTVVDHHTDTASYLLMYDTTATRYDPKPQIRTIAVNRFPGHGTFRTGPLPAAPEQRVSAARARSAPGTPGSRIPQPVQPPGVQPVNRGRSL